MNTVKKGDLFEEVCFGIVSKAILAGELGLLPASCRIYKKKGYYSKIRESDIIFDISIEVWLPNSERYTLVYFIECKDYSSSVPVNDLEEFYTKIDQVSGVNAKGVFMVKNSLQEGGRTFAKNQGMMVIEVTTNITYNIILHKANRYFEKQSEDFNNIPEIDAILFARKTKRTIKKLLIEHTLNHIRESNI